jgi:hypothetical protein
LFLVDSNGLSSSDTEGEDDNNSFDRNHQPFQRNISNQHKPKSKNKTGMVVQTPTDEQKLKSIKQNVQQRPGSKPLPQQNKERTTSNAPRDISSDDGDSLFDQSANNIVRTSSPNSVINTNNKQRERYPSIPESINSVSTMQSQPNQMHNNDDENRYKTDCASVTSSEFGLDSERGEPVLQQHNASVKCM